MTRMSNNPDEAVYVVAPRPDREHDAQWRSVVASVDGLRVIGGFGPSIQVAATDAGAAALRQLFDGALRVEPLRPRGSP